MQEKQALLAYLAIEDDEKFVEVALALALRSADQRVRVQAAAVAAYTRGRAGSVRWTMGLPRVQAALGSPAAPRSTCHPEVVEYPAMWRDVTAVPSKLARPHGRCVPDCRRLLPLCRRRGVHMDRLADPLAPRTDLHRRRHPAQGAHERAPLRQPANLLSIEHVRLDDNNLGTSREWPRRRRSIWPN